MTDTTTKETTYTPIDHSDTPLLQKGDQWENNHGTKLEIMNTRERIV